MVTLDVVATVVIFVFVFNDVDPYSLVPLLGTRILPLELFTQILHYYHDLLLPMARW